MKQFGETRIGDITPAAVALWINCMGRSPSTVRHYFYTLRLVMKYAQANGIIRRDPTQGIDLPEPRKMKDEEADRYPLTLAEALKLAAAVPEPWDMYVRLAAATGMRPEELTGLRLSDVTDDQTVTVRRVVVMHKGQPMVENVAKTSDSRRAIELDGETSKLLEDYIAKHRARAAKWFAANPGHKHPGDALPLFVGMGVFKARTAPAQDRHRRRLARLLHPLQARLVLHAALGLGPQGGRGAGDRPVLRPPTHARVPARGDARVAGRDDAHRGSRAPGPLPRSPPRPLRALPA